jgi:hypothetical protein
MTSVDRSLAEESPCKLNKFGDCLARIVNAGLRDETCCI